MQPAEGKKMIMDHTVNTSCSTRSLYLKKNNNCHVAGMQFLLHTAELMSCFIFAHTHTPHTDILRKKEQGREWKTQKTKHTKYQEEENVPSRHTKRCAKEKKQKKPWHFVHEILSQKQQVGNIAWQETRGKQYTLTARHVGEVLTGSTVSTILITQECHFSFDWEHIFFPSLQQQLLMGNEHHVQSDSNIIFVLQNTQPLSLHNFCPKCASHRQTTSKYLVTLRQTRY